MSDVFSWGEHGGHSAFQQGRMAPYTPRARSTDSIEIRDQGAVRSRNAA